MKNIILSIALLVSVSMASCKKEANTDPAAGNTPVSKMINVEYRISSETGSLNANYMFPNASGELENTVVLVNRKLEIVDFSVMSGQFLSVEAANQAPSHRTVQVELYINGVLMKQSISTSPSQKACASGIFY